MRSIAAILLVALLASTGVARGATEVAGVKFEDAARVGAATLALNGAGLRARLFIKVYAMGLYLPERKATTDAVLAQKGPKRIHIVTLRELTAQQFTEALVEGIQKNHNEAELAALKPAIDEFSTTMLAINTAAKGAVVQIDYLPDGGTQLVVNGQTRGKAIPGEAFYGALLRIWLGDRPAADDLKEALLGKSGG